MKKLQDDLWQSVEKNADKYLRTFAYFLERSSGNILLYSTGELVNILQMSELGGVDYQFLTHRHEASPAIKKTKELLHCQLACHQEEQAHVALHCEPDFVFNGGGYHVDGLTVIHTPGHTDGSACFYYQSPSGLTYLFTGDTLYLDNGQWKTLVLEGEGGNREDLKTSLASLRKLKVDMVIPSASIGDISFEEVDQARWLSIVDNALAELN